MLEAIKEAQATAKADNRPLAILGYVLGTDQTHRPRTAVSASDRGRGDLGEQQLQHRITGT